MGFPKCYDDIRLSSVICSVGHYKKFTEDQDFRALINADADFIIDNGLKAYLEREYLSRNDNKAIILNAIGDKVFAVDGNRHIAAILLACPRVTIGRVKEAVRFWKEGQEYFDENHLNWDNYTVYIPYETDTTKLSERNIPFREICDTFKPDHPLTKEIPATVEFDSGLFTNADRGRPFGELIAVL